MENKCKELFEKIDELYPEYLKVWEDVCNIESPTNYKPGVDAVCDYFVKMAEDRGWDVEVLKQEVAGNVACITINPDSDGAPVCLSGHMDTVHPIGLFGTPAVSMDDEKIYGPGVIDCKGGCVACFLVMDVLYKIGFKDRPVKLILQSDEETSSKTSGKKTVDFMCEKAKGAVAFLNTEGVSVENEKLCKVTLLRKGILRFRFSITGKAEHSSKCHEGANAIAEAAYKIIELEKYKEPDGLTFSCGVIKGGTVANTVPAQCSFIVDIRFSTYEEEMQARQIASEIAEKTFVEGCTCNLEEISSRPAMEYSEKNYLLLDKMNRIYKDIGLEILSPRKNAGGSDAAYITRAGIPCVDNIGVTGGRIHSEEEFGVLKSLARSAKYMAAVAMYIKD